MLAQNLWKLNSFIVVVDVVFILTICSYWYQIRHEIEEARTRNATSTLNLLMKNYDKRLRPKFGGKSRVNAHFKILKKNSGGHLLPKTLYSAMVFCHVRSLNFFCFISFIFFFRKTSHRVYRRVHRRYRRNFCYQHGKTLYVLGSMNFLDKYIFCQERWKALNAEVTKTLGGDTQRIMGTHKHGWRGGGGYWGMVQNV